MSRPAKFSHENIIDATARLAARDGPAKATMASIASELRAPTGSIYHRFASRDVLLGEVWLQAAEAFQSGFIARLSEPASRQAGLHAACYVAERVRQAPSEGRILLLHRREDFLVGGWPEAMSQRAAGLKQQAEQALKQFCQQRFERAHSDTLNSVSYALVHAPLAAVLPHLRANQPPPASVERLIEATYNAVMDLLDAASATQSKQGKHR